MGGFQAHQPKGWMIRLQFCRPSQVQVLRPKVPMRIMQCTWRLQNYEAPMDPCSPLWASHLRYLRINIKSLSCCSVQQCIHQCKFILVNKTDPTYTSLSLPFWPHRSASGPWPRTVARESSTPSRGHAAYSWSQGRDLMLCYPCARC